MKNEIRQIIAIGGGGFTLDLDDLSIDRYVLAQSGKKNPRVAYLPTAGGDGDAGIVRYYSAYTTLKCRPSHLSFFKRTPDLRKWMLAQDVIYVGGGNTKSMLAVWREWGVPDILREAWERGVVLAGTSAGAICWFEQGVTDSWAGGLRVVDALGFLPGSCCPHYDGEAERAPAYHRMVQRGEIMPGIAIDDHAAVHFSGTVIKRVIAGRKKCGAYQVSKQGRKLSVKTVKMP